MKLVCGHTSKTNIDKVIGYCVKCDKIQATIYSTKHPELNS